MCNVVSSVMMQRHRGEEERWRKEAMILEEILRGKRVTTEGGGRWRRSKRVIEEIEVRVREMRKGNN